MWTNTHTHTHTHTHLHTHVQYARMHRTQTHTHIPAHPRTCTTTQLPPHRDNHEEMMNYHNLHAQDQCHVDGVPGCVDTTHTHTHTHTRPREITCTDTPPTRTHASHTDTYTHTHTHAHRDNHEEMMNYQNLHAQDQCHVDGVPWCVDKYLHQSSHTGILHCMDSLEHKHTTAFKVRVCVCE